MTFALTSTNSYAVPNNGVLNNVVATDPPLKR